MSKLTKFRCQECGKHLKGKEGVIQVDERMAITYDSRLEKWREEREDCTKTGFGWMEKGSALFDETRPSRAEWGIYCIECGPQDNLYWFEVGRFDSETKVIDWTLHLLEKSWLSNTDWTDFVRQVLKNNGINSHSA